MTIPFRPIARFFTRTLHPAPKVDVSDAQALLKQMSHRRQMDGVLITANHFSAADFHSWWFVFLISATIPVDIHWVVASGWTNSGWLTPFTYWLFPIGAKILGFTSMPPMPPDPGEIEKRASSVRQVLEYARCSHNPVIGLTPEGGDNPGGVLGKLPAGVGRFMYLLSQYCPYVLPMGVWKEDGIINLKLGSPYLLQLPLEIPSTDKDKLVGNIVMHHIAELIPEQLRGEYL